MNEIVLNAFHDELEKIAERKLKKKQSGELTLDRSHFVRTLGDATKTQSRGPHPALNEEHQR